MTTISKDDILQADDLPIEEVECPEWGGSVAVRTMTGSDRDELENDLSVRQRQGKRTDLRGFKARLVQLTVVNGDGGLMFAKEEIAMLQKKSSTVIDRIAATAMKLNGLASGDVEEMLGNSPTDPSDSSGSD
jgi:hypothetical protein